MKKITILLAALTLISGVGTVIATNIIATNHIHDNKSSISHSGRTNAEGCHNDYKNNSYHCH
ncbi:MAG: hypothetical protein DIZ80_13125 [endosymbiont of Galathealinum brachiosum]|uniref:YHYH domain-containing protein n=1 Tax=endosymbiont of Galathealinum brachiosum TaxID=2200906 RepID=A0A370D9U4_9GAMM|nr:MAG: hypothetical protein DIZ80_13125 [endosymbiont of Galathealinum brachiosum]